MSLLEALLLDPPRIDIWVAKRTDNIAGSGTQDDRYDGSTATKFDTRDSRRSHLYLERPWGC